MDSSAIIKAVQTVTNKWAKQRRAEEREASAAFRRQQSLMGLDRVTIRDVAFDVMEEAFMAASTNGEFPAHARQIYYKARPLILAETGLTALSDQYFCQRLLPDYLAENPETTSDWDVVFDARGHFSEPHTGLIVPLGTLEVRGYLEDIENHQEQNIEIELANDREFSTRGPRHRFNGILFIEKEGFLPLFQAVKLAERFDIAIMSTKGMSVTASRMLVDQLCAEYDIPLLALHDFDKSGFSIVGTLQRDTRRYTFEREIHVLDLGLRVKDVHQWNLESEDVAYGKSDPEFNLQDNGATDEEIAFLCDRARSSGNHYVGKRVELNAFASGDFIQWIEAGLARHGIKKLIPDSDTLETAFRRAATLAIVDSQFKEIVEQARDKAAHLKIPKSLERQIRERLKSEPAVPWDRAVADVAVQFVKTVDSPDGDSAS